MADSGMNVAFDVHDFALQHTLCCGQFFRYVQLDNAYYVHSRDKLFKIQQTGTRLDVIGSSHHFVSSLFDLEQDYTPILKALATDAALRPLVAQLPGIRIMNQDPWECLIGFVCSAASNIKRIQQNMNALAEQFGQPIALDGFSSFTFPKPGAIDNPRALKLCRLGFREKYVQHINDCVTDAWLKRLRHKNYDDAKQALMELPGVGEKIADCVLLFSLGFRQAFPVDVWIKRVVEELYFDSKPVAEKNIAAFGRERFGMNAGLAQQYLFHWRRNGSL